MVESGVVSESAFHNKKSSGSSSAPVLLSVVTACCEDDRYLERAVKSVLEQDYPYFEHIVVDCRTPDLLEGYRHIRLGREGSGDYYSALKKGFEIARGEILVCLRAQDYFLSGAFSAVVPLFVDGATMVAGNVRVVDTEGGLDWVQVLKADLDSLLRHWDKNSLCVNSVGYFYRREAVSFVRKDDRFTDLEFLLEAAQRFSIDRTSQVLGVLGFDRGKAKTGAGRAVEYWREDNFPVIDRLASSLPQEIRRSFDYERRLGYQWRRFWAVKQIEREGLMERFLRNQLMMLPSNTTALVADARRPVTDGDTIVLLMEQGSADGDGFERSLRALLGLPCPVIRVRSISALPSDEPDQNRHGSLQEVVSVHGIETFHRRYGSRLRWKVITAVTDPVELICRSCLRDPSWRIRRDDLLSQLGSLVPDIEERFKGDIERIFGLDPFSVPFDHESGYSLIAAENCDVLLYKPEALRTSFGQAIAELFGISGAKLIEAPRPKEFQVEEDGDRLELPDSWLQEIYRSRYARHFYTGNQIAEQVEKWRRTGLRFDAFNRLPAEVSGSRSVPAIADPLFEDLEELGFPAYTKLEMGDPVFLVPSNRLTSFRAHYPGLTAVSDATHVPEGTHVVVFDIEAGGEPETGDLTSCNGVSFSREVVPSILTHKRLEECVCLESVAHRYAVLAVARTGSTYFCELLGRQGLGNPREHFRQPMVGMIRAGQSFQSLFEELISRGSVEGIFGTKIISHYIFDCFRDSDEQARLIEWLWGNSFALIHLVRDPIDCAVSAYFAHSTGVWHLTELPAPETARLYDTVLYDYKALRAQFDVFSEENRKLSSVLARWKSEILHVEYAELTEKPGDTVAGVARHLGLADFEPNGVERSTNRKISALVPRMAELNQQFREDLEASEWSA